MEARLGKNKVARRLGRNKNKIKFIDVLPTNDTITFNQFLPELFQEIKDIIIVITVSRKVVNFKKTCKEK